uniref:Protein cereblon homolog n=1 Tax=Ciona intestinalis TaxID=7719 RepID=F6QMC5_CIOIN|nr:protein cereblon homolog [Ciona intestinalis]|eukprot:XP_018671918.2 protein cereblon homolog [Ciona intestinalis]
MFFKAASFILVLNLIRLSFINCTNHDDDTIDSFLCRKCGETIANPKQFAHHQSPLALKCWNETLLNIPKVKIQLFQNPQKMQFNVVTFSTANVYAHEQAFSEASWFPGYVWRITTCPRCHSHLGWKFQPVNFNHVTHTEHETFVGIILDRLLENKHTDSVLLVPDSYKS